MKVIVVIILASIISSCGQDGQLYLTDEKRVVQLQKYKSGPAALARVQKRAEKERSLRTLAKELGIKEKQLRAQGNKAAADAAHLEMLEAQYDIGRIILERQSEGHSN